MKTDLAEAGAQIVNTVQDVMCMTNKGPIRVRPLFQLFSLVRHPIDLFVQCSLLEFLGELEFIVIANFQQLLLGPCDITRGVALPQHIVSMTRSWVGDNPYPRARVQRNLRLLTALDIWEVA